MFRVRIQLTAFAFALTAGAALVAAENQTEDLPKGASPITAVHRVVERPVSLHFDKRPLNQVVRELDRRLPIKVEMNREALGKIGYAPNTAVTVDVKNISLVAALAIMLRPLDLTWEERNETLIITSPEHSEDHENTRYYDVTGLIQGKGRKADFDSLSLLITSAVAPTSWPIGSFGPISPVVVGDTQLFAVPQTDEIHREIRLLLDALRQAKHGNLGDKKYVFQPPKKIQHPDDAVCRALNQHIRLEIPDFPKDAHDCVRPLGKVLHLLAEAANVNIMIDQVALRDSNMKPETPIRIRPMQGALRECLNRICRARWANEGTLHVDLMSSSPAPLRWRVANEVVWITTCEEEETIASTRIYDVCDMPAKPTESGVTKVGHWVIDRRWPHEREELTATIAKTIAPDTWENGSAGLVGYEGPGISVLVVSARWGVHQQIESFLAALREARRKGAAEAKDRQ